MTKTKVALSYGQQRLWALDQVDGPSATYHMPTALYLKGSVHIEALESAIIALIHRHESLRTIIIEDEISSLPTGYLLPSVDQDQSLQVVDLSINHPLSESQIECLIDEEITRPFNMSSDCSLRTKLLILDKQNSILILTLHHQAGDGVSRNILAQELNLAYSAYLNGQEPAWEPLPIQYSDWAAWQKESLEDDIQAKIARAKERLREAPELLTLALDYPRTAERAHRAAYVPIELGNDLTKSLQQLARQERTTLFTILYAAYGACLARLANQSQVVIGSPVAGRNRMETEGLIGFLLNTITLPLAVDQQCTGQELISRAKASVEAALIDQDLPFERLLEELGVARSLLHTPVFQALFAFESEEKLNIKLEGLQTTTRVVSPPIAKFDLTLHLNLTAQGTLAGSLEYDADLFAPASVQTWVQAFTQLLTHLVAHPEAPVLALPLTSPAERTALLAAAAGPAITLDPGALTLPELFAAQVAKTPQAVALVYESAPGVVQELTYAQLDGQANQLARYLIAQGIGPEQIVAILLERSPQMIVAMLGILKSGAAYLPLDPEYPSERLQFMLADSAASALISNLTLSQALTGSDASAIAALPPLIDLLAFTEQLAQYPTTPLDPSERVRPLLPDHIVYVMYTSGSTGKPKGVEFLHGSLMNLVLWQEKTLPYSGDRTLQYSPFGFDASAEEIAATLCRGAKLILIDEIKRKDGRELITYAGKHNVENLYTPFVVLGNMAEACKIFEIDAWPRAIFTAGEQLKITPEIRSQFISHPESRLHNFYGPTESHVVSNFSLEADAREWADLPPIGFPIWNTQLYILDAHLEPVPAGVVGELYIAGMGLARGYLGRAGLTSERFIACPFGTPGSRMYRTGDLARTRTDGAIEFLGRADDQVKIRGFRIELGEIEAALLACTPELAQVAVLAPRIGGDARLVAYLVPQVGASLPEFSELRTRLASTLPEYMVPAYFVSLASLPLTPNGKLDRRALPEPTGQSEVAYRAPTTPTQTLLCTLFSELTGTSPVGLDDSFFAIGGHSLLAMRLVARLREKLGITLPLRTLFETPHPEGLAQRLDLDKANFAKRGRIKSGMGRI